MISLGRPLKKGYRSRRLSQNREEDRKGFIVGATRRSSRIASASVVRAALTWERTEKPLEIEIPYALTKVHPIHAHLEASIHALSEEQTWRLGGGGGGGRWGEAGCLVEHEITTSRS